jgi:hypothetical protein
LTIKDYYFIDSNDQGIIQTGVESNALVGGKANPHNLRLQIFSGLLVIDKDDFVNITNPVVFNGSFNVDIFNQLGDTYPNTNVGRSGPFNSYWSQNPTIEQIQAGMPDMPASEVGIFLYSYDRVAYLGANAQAGVGSYDVRKRLYALEQDENGLPRIKKYDFSAEISASNATDSNTFVNHWLSVDSNGIYKTDQNQLDIEDDIDGGDNDLLSVSAVDSTEHLWDPEAHGTHEQWGGSPVGSHGAFNVYGDGENISTKISKPTQRYEASPSGTLIIKTQSKIEIGDFVYNILIELNPPEIQYFANLSTTYNREIQRVFLCRD